MPDWKVLVRERLGKLSRIPSNQGEIIAELAAHLEDVYEQLRSRGLSESDALDRTLNEVSDWRNLAMHIQRAQREEETMNQRTRMCWLPAFVSLLAAMLLWAISITIGLQPRFVARGLSTFVTYLTWLPVLPFCGAAGAYLSRRGGGQRSCCLLAGMFPSVLLSGLVAFFLLIGKIVLYKPQPLYFARGAFFGILLPSIALMLGTMPFLRNSKQRRASEITQT
jgi:hypothetical protein